MAIAADMLKTRLLNGGQATTGWCMMPAASSAEIMCDQGFDTVTIDLQHGLIDYQVALQMLQATARSGVAPLCRIPANEPGIVGKLLDAGTVGIICPMVNTRDDALRLARSCFYAPKGNRSFGPTRARRLYGESYWREANNVVTALAMIETRDALSSIDEILAVDGIDGVYIGPADLSLSLGYEPTLTSNSQEVLAAISMVHRKVQEVGKISGIHCGLGGSFRERFKEGFNFVACGTDFGLMEAGIAAELGSSVASSPASSSGQY